MRVAATSRSREKKGFPSVERLDRSSTAAAKPKSWMPFVTLVEPGDEVCSSRPNASHDFVNRPCRELEREGNGDQDQAALLPLGGGDPTDRLAAEDEHADPEREGPEGQQASDRPREDRRLRVRRRLHCARVAHLLVRARAQPGET
jgi:hypothetical protein